MTSLLKFDRSKIANNPTEYKEIELPSLVSQSKEDKAKLSVNGNYLIKRQHFALLFNIYSRNYFSYSSKNKILVLYKSSYFSLLGSLKKAFPRRLRRCSVVCRGGS